MYTESCVRRYKFTLPQQIIAVATVLGTPHSRGRGGGGGGGRLSKGIVFCLLHSTPDKL